MNNSKYLCVGYENSIHSSGLCQLFFKKILENGGLSNELYVTVKKNGKIEDFVTVRKSNYKSIKPIGNTNKSLNVNCGDDAIYAFKMVSYDYKPACYGESFYTDTTYYHDHVEDRKIQPYTYIGTHQILKPIISGGVPNDRIPHMESLMQLSAFVGDYRTLSYTYLSYIAIHLLGDNDPDLDLSFLEFVPSDFDSERENQHFEDHLTLWKYYNDGEMVIEESIEKLFNYYDFSDDYHSNYLKEPNKFDHYYGNAIYLAAKKLFWYGIRNTLRIKRNLKKINEQKREFERIISKYLTSREKIVYEEVIKEYGYDVQVYLNSTKDKHKNLQIKLHQIKKVDNLKIQQIGFTVDPQTKNWCLNKMIL